MGMVLDWMYSENILNNKFSIIQIYIACLFVYSFFFQRILKNIVNISYCIKGNGFNMEIEIRNKIVFILHL